jgi:hypothetical protein
MSWLATRGVPQWNLMTMRGRRVTGRQGKLRNLDQAAAAILQPVRQRFANPSFVTLIAYALVAKEYFSLHMPGSEPINSLAREESS